MTPHTTDRAGPHELCTDRAQSPNECSRSSAHHGCVSLARTQSYAHPPDSALWRAEKTAGRLNHGPLLLLPIAVSQYTRAWSCAVCVCVQSAVWDFLNNNVGHVELPILRS